MKNTEKAAPLYTILGSINKDSQLKIRVIPLTRAKQKDAVWIYPSGEGNKHIPVSDLNKITSNTNSIYFYQGYCHKSKITELSKRIKTMFAGETMVKETLKSVSAVKSKLSPATLPSVKEVIQKPAVVQKQTEPVVQEKIIPSVQVQEPIISASGKKMSKPDQADIQAVRSILSGNKKEFSVIYKRYYPIVLHKYSSSLKFNQELAEDLTADLFMKIYQLLGSYKENYTFNSWITRVANNHLLDYIRKQKLQTVSIDMGVSSERMNNEDAPSIAINVKEEGVLNPEDSILSEEKTEYVQAAIEGLDENCRSAIKMYFYEDKSYVEIAEIMKMPLGTLKNIIFRAKDKLKSAMKRDKNVLAVVLN